MIKIKKRVLVLILVALSSLLLMFKSKIIYWINPVNLQFEDIKKVKINKQIDSKWWVIIKSEASLKSMEEKYDVKLPENDFLKNYIVISSGTEIKKLTYRRISTFTLLNYKEAHYVGNVVFKKEIYPYTLFIYKVPKINLIPYDVAF